MVTGSHATGATELLSLAAAAGVTVTVRDGDLYLKGPRTAAALMQSIGARKAEVLCALAAGAGGKLPPPNVSPSEPLPARTGPGSGAEGDADPTEDALVTELRARVSDYWRDHIEGEIAEALSRADPVNRANRLRQLVEFARKFGGPAP